MRSFIYAVFDRNTFLSKSINHARLWLIGGVRSTYSAEVFETFALSFGLSLVILGKEGGLVAGAENGDISETGIEWGWTRVSAFTRTRSVVRP